MSATATAMAASADFEAPTRVDGLRELRAGWDMMRLAARTPELLRAPRGNGRVVMVVPGLRASDASLVPLRSFLAQRGHDVRPWGLGANTGDLDALLERTQASVRRIAEETGRAVNLVGWSLGGVYARETARDQPDTVHRIATFGTPLLGPRYTLGHTFFPEAELRRIETIIDERGQRPIKVPLTAMYSRNDGIVDWRTCPDRHTPGAVNVEVSSSHIGMGLDPTVWMHIARWLSA
jgi:pimeloyl-ACP methyl ester carboxylesterase